MQKNDANHYLPENLYDFSFKWSEHMLDTLKTIATIMILIGVK